MNKKHSHTIKTPIPRSDLGIQHGIQGGWQFRTWEKMGHMLYIVTWPGIWLVIKITPPRTRIIIEHDGRILLTKDWLGSGQWNLPGGGLHRNEPEAVGAARELYEETGISINPKDLTHVTSISSAGGFSTQLVFFKIALHAQPDVKTQKYEILDYMWADKKTLETLKMNRASRDVVASFVT